jgi:general secretion pathway protein A
MYNNYFGLTEAPFSIAPDPRFLYMSEQHREALAHLLFGVTSNGGFVLLTGEVGTGKTTVLRCLLEQLPEQTEVAFILNPKYSVTGLLSAICDDLGIDYNPSSEMKDYVDALNEHLLENHRNNLQTVLIIDEAQNLSTDVLETIRLLTNLETNTRKLLQVILIGQPELLAMLERPELRQMNQRITARYHLRALRQEELADYIAHRLSVAGVECQLFPKATIKYLYRLTEGVPRLVNIVCDRALLGTYVERENQVCNRTISNAASEVFGGKARLAASKRLLSGYGAVIGVLLALIVAAALTHHC